MPPKEWDAGVTLGKRVAMTSTALVVILLALVALWQARHFMHLQTGAPGSTVNAGMPRANSAGQRPLARPALPHIETDLQAAYASAKWLLPLVAGLEQRSLAGDAEATYLLSRIYSDCIWYHDPRLLEPTGIGPERLAGLYRSAAWMAQRCEGIDGTDAALSYSHYRGLAADQGSFAAHVEEVLAPTQLMQGQGASAEERRSVLAMALARGDPQAYLALSRVLGGYPADAMTALAPYPGGTQAASAAWMLAACDAGLPCGPGSPLLHQLCATGMMCGVESVAEAWGQILSPQELAQAQASAAALQQMSGRQRASK